MKGWQVQAFFSILMRTCVQLRAYRSLMDLPFKTVVSYQFKFSLLFTLLLFLSFIPFALTLKEESKNWISRHFPPSRIEQGIFHSEVEQPFVVSTNRFSVIIDDQRSLDDIPSHPHPGMIIHSNRFSMWMGWQIVWPDQQNPDHRQLLLGGGTFEDLPDGTVDASYVEKLFRAMIPVLALRECFFMFLMLLAFSLLWALFFGGLFAILELSTHRRLTFQQIYKIALFCMTPAGIVVSIFLLMQSASSTIPLAFFVTYGIYFVLATFVCKTPEQPEPVEDQRRE